MRALVTDSDREAWGVLVGALQSEREEETRDRAERGSVVRGSDQASVAAESTPSDVPERLLKGRTIPRMAEVSAPLSRYRPSRAMSRARPASSSRPFRSRSA